MSHTPLTIGCLAKATEVNVETVRYYQRVELVIESVKPLDGFRIYTDGENGHCPIVQSLTENCSNTSIKKRLIR